MLILGGGGGVVILLSEIFLFYLSLLFYCHVLDPLNRSSVWPDFEFYVNEIVLLI